MLIKDISLLLLVLVAVAHSQLEKPKLVFLQETFRHGARYPIYPNIYDNSIYATK